MRDVKGTGSGNQRGLLSAQVNGMVGQKVGSSVSPPNLPQENTNEAKIAERVCGPVFHSSVNADVPCI